MPKPLPKDSKGNVIQINVQNGFKKVKARPAERMFMLKEQYEAKYGPTVSSHEKQDQSIEGAYAIMFDSFQNKIGYPVNEESFSKYNVRVKSSAELPGLAVKDDPVTYLGKQMKEEFTAVIWNGETLPGKPGDYLVANPAKEDYRVINNLIFQKTYEFMEA